MKGELSICALGDLLLPEFLDSWTPDEHLTGILSRHDLVVGNLEVPACDTRNPQTKTYSLRASPSALDYLARIKVDAVSLANNHAMDQGEVGLLETIENLDSRKIHHFGAGRDLDEAKEYRVLKVSGTNVGFVSAACTLPGRSAASPDKPGIAPIGVTARLALDFRPLESPGRPPQVVCEVDFRAAEAIAETLRRAKEVCDHTVLALHWGVPMDTGYAPYQEELAKWMVDQSGVDLILGCHPHVLQTVERYKNSVILYSMGHFIASMEQIYDFYSRLRGLDIARWYRTAAFSLTLNSNRNRWQIEIWPLQLDQFGFPHAPSLHVRRRVLDEMEDLLRASDQDIAIYDDRIAVL